MEYAGIVMAITGALVIMDAVTNISCILEMLDLDLHDHFGRYQWKDVIDHSELL